MKISQPLIQTGEVVQADVAHETPCHGKGVKTGSLKQESCVQPVKATHELPVYRRVFRSRVSGAVLR